MASSKTGGNTPFDIDSWIEQLKRCEHIKEAEVKALCTRAKEILLDESNVQVVESPVTVSTFPRALFKVKTEIAVERGVVCE